ncbi:MAG: N-acetylmuramoyl-L-alanine amidase [Bacteroidaceae bacterium]|nr:N-acetylmuramoyl-L-alanine amidase [Bacteroidaceae bacterium]
MNFNKLLPRRLFSLLAVLFVAISLTAAEEFVVVIDAGHGGKDPGAQSANRKVNEKDIALKVALRAGELIRNAHPEVTVKYTRRTDVFVELKERARIANKAKADLFISIHCNAAEGRKAHGAEVFVLGSEEGRTQANLNAAKRENSVILLEKDYKESYQGFDPSSPESYIIFEYMQSEYLKESIELAQCIQKQLCTTAKRYDRGVHQAGFLVLHATTMPSILVELGFISNAEEEKFLNSADGKEKLSKSIANGFENYYKNLKKDKQSAPQTKQTSVSTAQASASSAQATAQPEQANKKIDQANKSQNQLTEENEKKTTSDIVFKVQFLTSSTKLPANSPRLKGLTDVSYYEEKGTYKYTCGNTTDLDKAQQLRKKVAATYKDAFLVAFRDGVRINTTDAINEYKALHP